MSSVPDASLKELIIHHLQLEHGPFWPPSHPLSPPSRMVAHMYPPFSPLGHRLLSIPPGSKSDPSTEATQIVGKILGSSDRNVSTALARLETIHAAESLHAALAKSNRLPVEVVYLLDGVVEKIEKRFFEEEEDPGQRMRVALALHAIRLVGTESYSEGMEWEELTRRLLEEDEVCGHGFGDIVRGDDGLEEVLGAARGLLAAGDSDNQRVTCFHQNFHVYLTERYSEFLASDGCRG
jgi:hypothetical protein